MAKRRITPDARTTTVLLGTLAKIPVDAPAKISRGESYRGVPYYRYEAVTSDIPWLVDIYARGYCRAQIGSSLSETHTSVASLMGYLYKKLTELSI